MTYFFKYNLELEFNYFYCKEIFSKVVWNLQDHCGFYRYNDIQEDYIHWKSLYGLLTEGYTRSKPRIQRQLQNHNHVFFHLWGFLDNWKQYSGSQHFITSFQPVCIRFHNCFTQWSMEKYVFMHFSVKFESLPSCAFLWS